MISSWLFHWIWVDFYVPVWPNIAASAFLAVGVLLKLRAMEVGRKIRHEELMRSHRELHAKLDALAASNGD
jgi:hypothetical protein